MGKLIGIIDIKIQLLDDYNNEFIFINKIGYANYYHRNYKKLVESLQLIKDFEEIKEWHNHIKNITNKDSNVTKSVLKPT